MGVEVCVSGKDCTKNTNKKSPTCVTLLGLELLVMYRYQLANLSRQWLK